MRPARAFLTGTSIVLGALAATLSTASAQENDPNPRLSFTFQQGVIYSDNPGLTSRSSSHFSARTDLDFGYLSETRRSSLSFDLGTSVQADLGSDADLQIVDPRAAFSYARFSRSARLSLRADYRESDVNALDESFTFEENTLSFGQGTRTNTGLFLTYETGLEAPFGLRLDAARQEQTYSDTSDPTLVDTLNTRYTVEGRARISPVLELTLGVEQRNYDAEDLLGTQRDTTVVSLDAAYDLRADLRADLGLSYARNELGTTGGTRRNNGFGYTLGLEKELPAGSIGVTLVSSETLNGAETKGTLDMTRIRPVSTFGLSMGAVKRESTGLEPLINLNYRRELPRGLFTASFNQVVRLDTENRDSIDSRFSVGYTQQINQVSQWSIDLTVDDQNALDVEDDRRRNDLGLSYIRQVTRDWDMVAEYSYIKLQEDQRSDRDENKISLSLKRTFQSK